MKMKYVLPIAFSAMLLSSCDDMAFLQIKPDNLELIEDRIQTKDDLEKLLLGAYNQVRSGGFMGGTALRGFNVIADESTANTATFEWVQMSNHTMNLMNAVGRDTWSNTYNAINRANQVGYSDLAESILSNDPETLAEFRAEASFIRALGYFHLVRGFGLAYCEENKDVPEMGVPLRLRGVLDRETAFEVVQRSTVEEVYNQIIEDLEYAIEHLSPSNTLLSGRATIDGAKGLLAKVYFYKGDFASAARYAGEVVATGNYDIDADMTAKFARAEKGTTTKEVVAMIPSASTIEDSWSGLRDYRTNGLALSVYHPSDDLIAAYDQENDLRFKTFYAYIDNSWYTTKFDYEYMDAIILGYNELLLIYAESLAESSSEQTDLEQALEALNKIEARAYGQAVTTSLDKATIIQAVQKERRLEIASQGERLFELKRLKQNVRGDDWNSFKVMFQIPDIEQSGNPDIKMNE